MEVTKPYKSIGFGAMDVTKPYKFIGFGAMDVTKPYKFIGPSQNNQNVNWHCFVQGGFCRQRHSHRNTDPK